MTTKMVDGTLMRDGREIKPSVGSTIEPDGWHFSQCLQGSTWDKAEFYLGTGFQYGVTEVAVNITITGRTIRSRAGNRWVRVRIEFVGDGTPSTFQRGWMCI